MISIKTNSFDDATENLSLEIPFYRSEWNFTASISMLTVSLKSTFLSSVLHYFLFKAGNVD